MSLERKSTDSTVRGRLTESAALGQLANFTAYDREPNLAEIPDHGIVLADISGTVYIYARIGSDRYRIALTLV